MKHLSRAALLVLSTLIASAALLACGEDGDETEPPPAASIAEIEVDPGPFESDEDFVAAANDFCEQTAVFYERTPVYASFPAGLVSEFEARIELEEQYLAKAREIEPTESKAEGWELFLELEQDLIAAYEEVLAAAEDDDLDGANAILGDDAAAIIEEQEAILSELGLDCAGVGDEQAEIEAPEPVLEVPAELAPANTISEAAEEHLETLGSGDCAAIAEILHSQLYAEEQEDCSADEELAETAEIAGTAGYGPVGVAIVESPDSVPAYFQFVRDPGDEGNLRFTGVQYAEGGGLRPPNEGIDANQTVQAAVEAIRGNDPEALNETLSTDVPAEGQSFEQDGPFDQLGTDPEYAERIVADIREDSEAAPELIAADQVNAFYLLETSGADYLLVLAHEPGSEDEYRFSAYWALSD